MTEEVQKQQVLAETREVVAQTRRRLRLTEQFLSFIEPLTKVQAQRIIENAVQIRGALNGGFAGTEIIPAPDRAAPKPRGDEELTGGQIEQLLKYWNREMEHCPLDVEQMGEVFMWITKLENGDLEDVMLRKMSCNLVFNADRSLEDRFLAADMKRKEVHIRHLETIWYYRSECDGEQCVRAELVSFPRYIDSREEVIQELARFGLKPAGIDHLITFAHRALYDNWTHGQLTISGLGSVGYRDQNRNRSPLLFSPSVDGEKWELNDHHHHKGRDIDGWAQHGGPAWNQWLLAVRAS